MKDEEKFFADFLRDVPRGLESVPLHRQSIPQARWVTPERIMESAALAYDPDGPGGKVLIGALGGKLIGIDDNRHILTVGGSRSGKSVTLIDNLLFYPGSALCTDPKGELARITARRRAALGQKVYVLDPFNRCGADAALFRASYNPLAVLRADSPTIIEDATLIADALVVVTGQEKDPHWNESARNFIEGLILHVATEPAYEGRRNLLTVRGLVNCALMRAPSGDKDDEEEDDEGPADFVVKGEMLANARRIAESLGDEDLAGALEGAARDFYDKRGTEQAGVLSTVRRHTKFLDYKAMRRVLEGHDFDLADLKRDPRGVTVYLCLPAGRMGPCNRWLRLFLNQLLDAAEQEQTRPGTPKVLVCLDEFPVLGFMSQLQDAAGQVASFNLRLWIVIQDWGQGKTLYGERWESFAANAGILQAFGNADLATTEYLSRRLGKTPVEVTRVGEVSLQQTDQGLTGRSQARELHDLLAPEEIARMFSRDDRLKRQLVLWSGRRPMILQRVEYYDDKSPVYRWFKGKYAP